MEEINKILNLVEKADSREQQKKTYKMVEQLRQNILELHESLADVKSTSASPRDSPQTSKSEFDLNTLMTELTQQMAKEVEGKVNKLEIKVKEEVEKIVKGIKW